jgi:DNA-binding IclR family transcriptional regulator
MRMANRTPRPLVPAVDRAARTLRLLAARPEGRGLSDLARDLDVSKASLREILLTLGRYGLVERDADLRFTLGPEVSRLAGAPRQDLLTRSTPVVRALAAGVGQTAILGLPEGTQLRLAVVAAPKATLHVSARTGGYIPLATGCHGRVFVEKLPLGFDDGEFVEGVRAVAAPVTDEDGVPVACLMVVGFKRTLSMARLRGIGRRLLRDAARLSTAPMNGVKP